MATIDELRKIRIEKIKKLETVGILAYPAKTNRTHTIAEALKNFSKLVKAKKRVVLVGRIMAQRGHGGATFLNIYDGSLKQDTGKVSAEISLDDNKPISVITSGFGTIQVLLKKDKLGEKGYQFFLDIFDIGDFVEIKGTLFTTKRGEKTIEAEDYKMLSKSLLPLPEKWHGLQDIEERLRKRYLDILFNSEVKEMIKKRAVFWHSIREFLIERGRQFRNEGIDAEHLQDYTQMEFYWAYTDYKQGMKLVEEMYKYVIKKTFGTLKFKIKNFNVDFSKKW